jgi:signal transduction histidine kinase
MATLRLRADHQDVPWWTYPLALSIIHVGTQISLLTKHNPSVSEYYLPTAISLVLVYWWGLKPVLAAMYLNGTFTAPLWGNPTEQWYYWFVFSIPETLFPFMSWLLFRVVYKGKFWLPDVQNLVLFLVMALLIPAIIEILLLQGLMVWLGGESINTFWLYVTSNLLSEFTTAFFVALPALYYLTPFVLKRDQIFETDITRPKIKKLKRTTILELSGIFLILLVLCFLLEFKTYWFIYGIASLYAAIRFGFGPCLVTNLYIVIIVYLLPKLLDIFGKNTVSGFEDASEVLFGVNLLFVFSAITGRAFSDIRLAKVEAVKKNRQLEKVNSDLKKINKELDCFVYSVSHDLSAPIKTIRGLINLSRLTNDPNHHSQNLNMIEESIFKLEYFISEILDFSRNERQEIVQEKFHLADLLDEILYKSQYPCDLSNAKIDIDLQVNEIAQDRSRVKIILGNLLSNALKFHKESDHLHIQIKSRQIGPEVLIEVSDNGEGIRKEYLGRIFNMFFRGSQRATGAGLGLYIAKEVAKKIKGKISVESEYGKGSKFIFKFKDH